MTARVLLVRHAEAVCNVQDRWAGHVSCAGLTARGREQCAIAAERLRQIVGDDDVQIWCSSMRRSVETANVVAERLGIPAEHVVRRCGLCERHPGPLDGWPIGDTSAMEVEPAGVETPLAFMARARRSLLAASGAPGAAGTVVVVTHTGVVRASFWVFGGVAAALPFVVSPANASVTGWSRVNGAGIDWRLDRYNDFPGVQA